MNVFLHKYNNLIQTIKWKLTEKLKKENMANIY